MRGCKPLPDLYLNEKAREIAPIRMTGNYGGEILRGVRAFKPVEPTTGLFAGDLHSSVGQAALTYASAVAGHPLTFAALKQCPWYMYGVFALEETQVTMRSPYLDNEFVRTVFRSPFSAFASNDVSMRLIADGNRASSWDPDRPRSWVEIAARLQKQHHMVFWSSFSKRSTRMTWVCRSRSPALTTRFLRSARAAFSWKT